MGWTELALSKPQCQKKKKGSETLKGKDTTVIERY